MTGIERRSTAGRQISRARAVVSNPRAIGMFNKAGGTLLIGAGVATVAIRSGMRPASHGCEIVGGRWKHRDHELPVSPAAACRCPSADA